MDFFSVILTDFAEYPKGALFGAIFSILACLINIYLIKVPRNRWMRLNILSISMLLLWIFWGPCEQESGFARKVNFSNLHKITRELWYENNIGFFFENSNGRKIVFLVELCGKKSDIQPYVGKSVTIYEHNRFIYQLEHNGKVIFDLDRSNSKVWLSNLTDIIVYYLLPFFVVFMLYMMVLWANSKKI